MGESADTVGRARTGDRSALADLWRSHHPRVVRYLRGAGSASPEDLASNIWIEVARSLHRFDGGDEAFVAWLFTIARRRLIDERRQQQRRPEVLVDQLPERSEPFPPVDDVSAALALVRTLPEEQAEVVLLRVVGGLDVSDVAGIVGISPGAVRVRAHRALRRLQETLQEQARENMQESSAPAVTPEDAPSILSS